MRTMQKYLIFCLIFFSQIFAMEESDINHFFEKGNQAYLQENYSEAIKNYEMIIANGFENGTLYFNLGNAYHKIGNIGLSILNYERAMKWRPNDENLLFNLKLVNLKVKDRIDLPKEFFLFKWHRNYITYFLSNQWALFLTLFAFVIAILSGLILNFKHLRISKIFKPALSFFIVLFFLCLYPLIQKDKLENNHNTGIIIKKEVKSLSAPQDGTTQLFVVHEGTKVNILDQDNDWIKVELIDGKQGWIKIGQVGII